MDVPLEAAELCQAITIKAQPLLERGHPPALPDGQVGIQLLEACQRAMCSLVRANLPVLTDADLIEATRTRLEQLNTNAKGVLMIESIWDHEKVEAVLQEAVGSK